MADTKLSKILPPQLFNSNLNSDFNRNFFSYAFFKKCGEITVSADKKYFGLNCAFCNETYLQLYVFIQHISEEQGKDIDSLYNNELVDKQSLSCGWNVSPTSCGSINNASNVSLNETNVEKATKTVAAATTTTNTMTTLATLLSEVDFDFFEKTEEAAELQELVYILEDNSNNNDDLNNVAEEEAVEPFHVDSNEKSPQQTKTKTAPLVEKGHNGIERTQSEKNNENRNKDNFMDTEEECIDAMTGGITKQKNHTTAKHEEWDMRNSTLSIIPTESTRITTRTRTTQRIGYNRDVINYLLEAYKNNAKLWDPNHPMYKYNAPRNVFNELSEPLANDLNVKLSGVEIFHIIIGLRSRYRRELTKMQACNNQNKQKVSNLWYYEKMHFLRDIIESKRADRKLRSQQKNQLKLVEITKKNVNSIDSKSPKALQSKENLSYLIDAFKQREILWNTEHAEHTNCDKLKLYEQISAELLKEKHIEMKPSMCKIEMEKLISRYRKEFNALQRRKGLHIPTLWCFEQMEFMRPVIEMEFLKRKRRKNGIITPTPRTRLIKAETFIFNNIEAQLKFIEIYKSYPALWCCENPDYRSTKYRDEAMKNMLNKFNETFNVEVTIEQLDKTIAALRKSYSQEKLKLLTRKTSVTTNDEDTNESVISSSSSSSSNNTSIINSKPSNYTISPQAYESFVSFLDTNIGPFRCDICEMIIRTSDQYKIHKSAHDGTLPFVCVLCSKGFQVPGNLAIHIRRHKRDFPYSCEECNKSFATSTEVAIHQRVHTGDRPYICDLCGKTFKTWSFFDIHRRVHLNQSTFLCPICDKGFYEKNRYTAHMNGHLNIRKHSCKTCDKSFTTFANLQKHNELHLPVRKYKCEVCGLRFKQFASLRWHKRKTHAADAGCDDDSMEQ